MIAKVLVHSASGRSCKTVASCATLDEARTVARQLRDGEEEMPFRRHGSVSIWYAGEFWDGVSQRELATWEPR